MARARLARKNEHAGKAKVFIFSGAEDKQRVKSWKSVGTIVPQDAKKWQSATVSGRGKFVASCKIRFFKQLRTEKADPEQGNWLLDCDQNSRTIRNGGFMAVACKRVDCGVGTGGLAYRA